MLGRNVCAQKGAELRNSTTEEAGLSWSCVTLLPLSLVAFQGAVVLQGKPSTPGAKGSEKRRKSPEQSEQQVRGGQFLQVCSAGMQWWCLESVAAAAEGGIFRENIF